MKILDFLGSLALFHAIRDLFCPTRHHSDAPPRSRDYTAPAPNNSYNDYTTPTNDTIDDDLDDDLMF